MILLNENNCSDLALFFKLSNICKKKVVHINWWKNMFFLISLSYTCLISFLCDVIIIDQDQFMFYDWFKDFFKFVILMYTHVKSVLVCPVLYVQEVFFIYKSWVDDESWTRLIEHPY